MEWVWLSLFQSQKLPAHTFASGVEVLEYIKYRYERLWYCTVVRNTYCSKSVNPSPARF